jgi:hypothetical protein
MIVQNNHYFETFASRIQLKVNVQHFYVNLYINKTNYDRPEYGASTYST